MSIGFTPSGTSVECHDNPRRFLAGARNSSSRGHGTPALDAGPLTDISSAHEGPMIRRDFLRTIGLAAAAGAIPNGVSARQQSSTTAPAAAPRALRYDLHTHYYPEA